MNQVTCTSGSSRAPVSISLTGPGSITNEGIGSCGTAVGGTVHEGSSRGYVYCSISWSSQISTVDNCRVQRNTISERVSTEKTTTILTCAHWLTTIPATSSTHSCCVVTQIIASVTDIGCCRALSSGGISVTVHDHTISYHIEVWTSHWKGREQSVTSVMMN